MGIYVGLGLFLLALYGAHHWLLGREVPRPLQAVMDAEIYSFNSGWIIRRHVHQPEATVLVMHGFLENPLYFTGYYQDPRIELIMLGATGYQLPIQSTRHKTGPWSHSSTQRVGTIAADAELLNLALEHLTSTRNLRVHGHSRGGAVVLEAARQRPDLFSGAEVLLEAPALPQGRPYRQQPAIVRWILPLLHLLWQHKPDAALSSPIWGPQSPDKRELIMAMPFNPRDSRLLLTNLQDLLDWMRDTGSDIYSHVQRGAVLVPARDRILHSGAMLDSARQAENLQIVEVPDGSHFVILDHPESIPPLIRNP